jgi:60 kDa SS-A/Ro ribonucleoprotein
MQANVHAAGSQPRTWEGAVAVRLAPLQQLRRLVLTGLLGEQTFYVSGVALADRLRELVPHCRPEAVATLAREARDEMYLRHMPLLLVRELARRPGCGTLVAATLAHVIQRPDELTEYLALYWAGHADQDKEPLSAGSKRGLARAMAKFSAFALARYDRDRQVKLRDVLRLTHPTPDTQEQAALWRGVIARTLPAPDTWEVALSAGADPKVTFERLLASGTLGGLAFLRNLRAMTIAGVDPALIAARCAQPFAKVLPFRFVTAARHAPTYAPLLSAAMLQVTATLPRLPGHTTVLVDVSGSMDSPLSAKSEVTRMDAAAGLAVLVLELAEHGRVFTFSDHLQEVPGYHGLPLVAAILGSQPHNGTALAGALAALPAVADRLIVITDEQTADDVRQVAPTAAQRYLINVAPYQYGVGYGEWVHIDGWSERVLDFIQALEAEEAA